MVSVAQAAVAELTARKGPGSPCNMVSVAQAAVAELTARKGTLEAENRRMSMQILQLEAEVERSKCVYEPAYAHVGSCNRTHTHTHTHARARTSGHEAGQPMMQPSNCSPSPSAA